MGLRGHLKLHIRPATQGHTSDPFSVGPRKIAPLVSLGPRVHFVSEDSADAVCKHEGFSKAGTVRTTTLHIMGLSMSAVRVSTLEILTPSSTKMIVNVECLKEGQKPCTADSDGNIGSGNKGKNNLGTKNVGNYNIGNSNVGTANWGDNNSGMSNPCFNKTRHRIIVSDCSLLVFRKQVAASTRQEVAIPSCQDVFPRSH
ncbi:hypothetical protein ACKKBG_A26090 [Auxenochlorella protothecoides x Auxenochlorella symbiontica]